MYFPITSILMRTIFVYVLFFIALVSASIFSILCINLSFSAQRVLQSCPLSAAPVYTSIYILKSIHHFSMISLHPDKNHYRIQYMKKITPDKVEDGMILGREVCGSSGNVLLSKGTQLSEALGKRLVNWGITHIFIEGEEDSLLEENTVTISPEQLKGQLMEKFSNVIDNPIMKKIFVAAYQFRLQNNN